MIEKLEQCPRCKEEGNSWKYDFQRCDLCGYPDMDIQIYHCPECKENWNYGLQVSNSNCRANEENICPGCTLAKDIEQWRRATKIREMEEKGMANEDMQMGYEDHLAETHDQISTLTAQLAEAKDEVIDLSYLWKEEAEINEKLEAENTKLKFDLKEITGGLKDKMLELKTQLKEARAEVEELIEFLEKHYLAYGSSMTWEQSKKEIRKWAGGMASSGRD